jgi:hypothetical protein
MMTAPKRPPRKPRPVTEETYDAVRVLHAEGHGRNEIARRLSRSPRTVSVIAAELNLAFDRTMTEEATRARMADLNALRAQLAVDLTHDAMRLSGAMWEPAVVYSFGGKDNEYAEQAVDEPPADAKKNLMAAAGMAIDRSLRLVPPADDQGADRARSMVGQLIIGLTQVYREQQAQEAGGEGGGDAP